MCKYGLRPNLRRAPRSTVRRREDDEQRTVLRLNPLVAPIKVTVFPLLSDERLVARTQRIASDLTSAGIFNKARPMRGLPA